MNNGWMGLLGGLGQGLQQLGMMQMQHAQRMEEAQQEAEIFKQKQRYLENLKAPAEKTETVDDPDNKGHKIAVTKQWVPPPDDNTPGHYQEVARVHVPVKWQKETIKNGENEQDYYVDPDNPDNRKAIGDPSPRWNPQEKIRTGIEAQNAATSQGHLALDRVKFIQEGMDKQNKDKPDHERYSYHVEDDPDTGVHTGYAFDKFTGQRKKVTDKPPMTAGGGLMDDMGQPKTDPGEFAPKPDIFSSGPLSQLSPSASTGGAGSAGSMAPSGAKGADHGGPPKLQINKVTGAKRYVYPDGTVQPL